MRAVCGNVSEWADAWHASKGWRWTIQQLSRAATTVTLVAAAAMKSDVAFYILLALTCVCSMIDSACLLTGSQETAENRREYADDLLTIREQLGVRYSPRFREYVLDQPECDGRMEGSGAMHTWAMLQPLLMLVTVGGAQLPLPWFLAFLAAREAVTRFGPFTVPTASICRLRTQFEDTQRTAVHNLAEEFRRRSYAANPPAAQRSRMIHIAA
jgi:hypothetical protein